MKSIDSVHPRTRPLNAERQCRHFTTIILYSILRVWNEIEFQLFIGKGVQVLERVQKRCTRNLPGLEDISYEEGIWIVLTRVSETEEMLIESANRNL